MEILSVAGLSDLRSFRRSERRFLSSIHHLSYWAGTIPFLAPSSSGNFLDSHFGVRSEYSFRTGKVLFSALAELMFVIPFISTEVKGIVESSASFEAYLSKGRLHILDMFLLVVQNWNSPVFENSRELDDLMQFLPKDINDNLDDG